MLRFTIRELLILTVNAGLAVGGGWTGRMNAKHGKRWFRFSLRLALVLTLGIVIGSFGSSLELRLLGQGQPSMQSVNVRLKVLEIPRTSLAGLGLGASSTSDARSTLPAAEVLKRIAILQESKSIRVVTQPTLVTVSGRATWMRIGDEIPYIKRTGDGAITIGWQPIGTQVEILPTLKRNGQIDLKIETEHSRPSKAQSAEYKLVPVPTTPPIERITALAAFDITSGATVVFTGQADMAGSTESERVLVFVATVEGSVPR
ncbi:MAG: type II and III secretion system protein [Planctomycetaceae bacterium]|nr:type II and III secretion system protein [Planctomycetaceae bacterium]